MDDEEQRDDRKPCVHERWHCDECHDNERYDRAAVAEAAERNRRPGDTSAAIAANRRRGLDRKAEELRAAGFLVVGPEGADEAAGYLPRGLWPDVDKARGLERHEFDAACPDRLCPANAPGGGRHFH
jgi:hypothetical protein